MLFRREDKVSQFKLTAVQYAILGIFLVLGYGLWRLQVGGHEEYAKAAEQNRIRQIPILAPRGKLIDREGRIIVDNYPSFSALLLRDQTKDLLADADKIAAGLHMDPDEVKTRISRFARAPQYQPLILKDDITPDELAFIESHKNELPELDTIMSHRRLYPKNGFMAHLIGYVGEINEDMLNQPQFEFYNPGDVVGMAGVERQYNDWLMGKNGSRNAIVTARGKEVGVMSETPAVPGKQLKLTIDLDVQIAAEEALGDKNGAIIAMDPHTGEVLGMVSRPTFDPNAFAVRISRKEWNALITDPAKPLLNKAIQAQLAPGSTFKIIMSMAGVQEHVAQTMNVHCSGSAEFYGHRFGCWVKGGHGSVDLSRAISESCDVFFYTLAEKLGIDRIAKYGTMLGLGQRTGIDLPNEVSGIMPSEEWKIKNFKQKWFGGETINVGIGQGAVTTTPVQLMRAIGAISMGGKLVVPHVVNPTNMPPDFIGVSKADTGSKQIDLDSDGWTTITDAMVRVLLPGGTAPSAHIPGMEIAGKTGSAQVVSLENRAKFANREEFAQNGWFVGFTPRRNPDIIVVCLFQGGEHGRLAARVATQVIKAYVEKRRKVEPNYAREVLPQKTPANSDTAKARPLSTAHGSVDGVEVAGFWNEQGERHGDHNEDALRGGRIQLDLAAAHKQRTLTAAPGLEGLN